MKPFVFDSAITNPIDVARRDRMEFFVESILDHRGNLSRMMEIEFLVRWLNFNDSHDSWEPYANLRDNQRLHVYLLEKNYSVSSQGSFVEFFHQFSTSSPPTSIL